MTDLVIRNGTVIDGTGAEPFEADIAIQDGKITAGRGRGGSVSLSAARPAAPDQPDVPTPASLAPLRRTPRNSSCTRRRSRTN